MVEILITTHLKIPLWKDVVLRRTSLNNQRRPILVFLDQISASLNDNNNNDT